MPRANTKTLIYNDWSKGEFGRIAPDRAPDGSFTGTNVVVYADGHIGPRPGLREVVLSNVPTGTVRGFGFCPTSLNSEASHWFVIGREVFLFRPRTEGYSVVQTDLDIDVAGGGTDYIWWKESTRNLGGKVYMTVPGDRSYTIDLNDAQLRNAHTSGTSPGGNDIETYKDRLVVAESSPSMRVQFSEAADYQDWSEVADYFDVGASWPVTAIHEFRDGLVIFTPSGHWLVTGSLGSSATLRRVSESLPARKRAIVATPEDMFYIPSSRSAPVLYNGSFGDEDQLDHLENWKSATTADACGVAPYGNRDVIFVSEDSEMLWRKNGAWTKHEYEVTAGPAVTRFFDYNAILTDGGGPGTAPKFYWLATSLNRPAFTTDTTAQPGDDSDTPLEASFRLPDYYSDNGDDVRVRRVVVDFTHYTTGATSPATNNITITANALGRYDLDGNGDDETFSWTEAQAGGTSGTKARYVAKFGQVGWGGGARIELSDLRGVKIQRVLVDIETREATPRG